MCERERERERERESMDTRNYTDCSLKIETLACHPCQTVHLLHVVSSRTQCVNVHILRCRRVDKFHPIPWLLFKFSVVIMPIVNPV